MLDCQLYGLRAGGHHGTNVLLHTVAVLLLFHVLRQMTGAVWKSAIVAALFAIHPLHVESVAWISERKDVLSAVFFLLMLEAYVRYTRAPSAIRYLTVAVLFIAGLMSKPMLVTVPFVLLLLDYWPLGRFAPPLPSKTKGAKTMHHRRAIHLIIEKIPLLIAAVGACVVTYTVQKRAVGAIPPLPLVWRAENAVASYVIYIWKTVWPTRLAVFYPHPNNGLALWAVCVAAAFLLAVTLAVIVVRRERPYLFTGWFWYVGMLLPVIGLIQVGEQGHADRYTYLPHVGLFILSIWLIADLTIIPQSRAPLAIAAATIIIIALACAAFIQTSYWRNSQTLWSHALAVTSDNDVAHNNLGYLRNERGELDQAISHFEAASRIRARKLDPHYNVGSAFVQMNLADALGQKGQTDEAMVHYEAAINLSPNYADAYYNRGNILFASGRTDEAIADLEKTLQLQPNHADAYTCLGNALLRQGATNEAIAHYEKAASLSPADPHSRNNMAWVLATSSDSSLRDGAKAVKFAEQAVALSGGRDPSFVRTLAAALAESDRFSDAVAIARQAAGIAAMQGKTKLANKIEKDLMFYRGHMPLRENSVGD